MRLGVIALIHVSVPLGYSLSAVYFPVIILELIIVLRVALQHHLGVVCAPIYCTKVASKLARTYTDKHGLKDLCKELLGVDISKQQQSSDWGARKLTKEQLAYAASDVLYLHALRDRLERMLKREGRGQLAKACFEFLPTRAQLDLAGWADVDILAHS